MKAIECPYCEMELSPSQVESEGGLCPECGHPISLDIYDENEDDDEDLEDDGEDEDDDDF